MNGRWYLASLAAFVVFGLLVSDLWSYAVGLVVTAMVLTALEMADER